MGIGCAIRTVRKFASLEFTAAIRSTGFSGLFGITVTIRTLRLTVNELARIMLDVVSLAEETFARARTTRNTVRAPFSHKLHELA